MEQTAEIVFKYFPELTPLQRERFGVLYELYAQWNGRINVVSRKDFGQLYLRHVLHSLAIAKVCMFDNGARIMDVGTGGGFPGIPLAIMFPNAEFTLVDSIGKKITVVKGIVDDLKLDNVTAANARAEQLEGKFDYVVSRAVTDMSAFIPWVWGKIAAGRAGTLPNGILYLKGGEDLAQELSATKKRHELFDIHDLFCEDFFETKKVVYFPR